MNNGLIPATIFKYEMDLLPLDDAIVFKFVFVTPDKPDETKDAIASRWYAVKPSTARAMITDLSRQLQRLEALAVSQDPQAPTH